MISMIWRSRRLSPARLVASGTRRTGCGVRDGPAARRFRRVDDASPAAPCGSAEKSARAELSARAHRVSREMLPVGRMEMERRERGDGEPFTGPAAVEVREGGL